MSSLVLIGIGIFFVLLATFPYEKVIEKLFHKKVRDKLKEVAHEKDKKDEKQTDGKE